MTINAMPSINSSLNYFDYHFIYFSYLLTSDNQWISQNRKHTAHCTKRQCSKPTTNNKASLPDSK